MSGIDIIKIVCIVNLILHGNAEKYLKQIKTLRKKKP